MEEHTDKITKFDELQDKMKHYKWLCNIAREYKSIIDCIEREKEHFIIYGFSYTARGDIRTFKVNPHRTIPYSFIKDGLSSALAKKQLLSYADESNPKIEAMADLERTFECNPERLPQWLKDKFAKKHLAGTI